MAKRIHVSKRKAALVVSLAIVLMLSTVLKVSTKILPATDGLRVPLGWVFVSDYGSYPCVDLRAYNAGVAHHRSIGWPLDYGDLTDGGGCGYINPIAGVVDFLFLVAVYIPFSLIALYVVQRLRQERSV